MKIILAETAGFCFGVNNAIRIAGETLVRGGTINTLGPLIHNDQVVNDLKEKGIGIISEISEVPEGSRVIIRAHGVAPGIYREAEERNIEIVDATCPYVKKIHKLVKKMHEDGYTIVIAGDRNHPEVIGINGWCGNSALIAGTPEEAETFAPVGGKCCLVAQTTMTRERFDGIYEKLKEKCKSVVKFDTICSATASRQEEAEKIARISDVMLVIGSRKSSNTRKLFEICSKYCKKTYLAETYGDLPPINPEEVQTLGITAGASTPERTIKEVFEKMDELNKQEKEMSFAEAFENSMVTLRNGEVVKGRIIGYNNTEIFVDLGYKSDGIIPVEEFTDDPDFEPETGVNIGDEIDVFIVKVNDGEGNVMLSKKRVDTMRSLEIVEEAYKNKTPVEGKVIEVTNGGVIVSVNGVRVFVPASQLDEKYVKDLGEFLKQTVTIKIIEMNRQKRKFVGSRRAVLAEAREEMEKQVWSNIETGKKYTGTVKSLTDFGAFVDIGGVDGLVHVSEMSWLKVKHPSELVKVGDQVEVTVLEFDAEKKRISLSMKKEEDNPWYRVSEKYKVGDIVKGTVVRLVPFGAFIELEKGLDGLVHISQISNVRIAKPGDVLKTGQSVEAKIVEVNEEAKRISLSIKEVNPIDPEPAANEQKADEKAPEAQQDEKAGKEKEEEIPNEHREELSNTIGDIIGSLDEIK
jgi:4-hydroxy-3-methylbut-2-enyl diphosphate reductase